jgi:hypothetical protein
VPVLLVFVRPRNLANLFLPICFALMWTYIYTHFDRTWTNQEYFDLLLFRGSRQENVFVATAYGLVLLRESIDRFAGTWARDLTKKFYEFAGKLWWKLRLRTPW